MATAFLLTGPPGVGKTTLLRQLLRALQLPAGGFFTAEIRQGGRRSGFALEDLAGRRGVLAREAGAQDTGGPRVGRYRVDVGALEAVGVAALERAHEGAALIVIDEIGKMEACSPRFRAAVERALEGPNAVVLGTVLQAAHPWIDRVKAHPAVTLVPVAAATRAATLEDLAGRVRAAWAAAGHASGGGALPPGRRAPRGARPGGRI